MEGNRPKRRKDEYDPYTIFEKDGQYYVSFKDGQGALHKFEISDVLYDMFHSFGSSRTDKKTMVCGCPILI